MDQLDAAAIGFRAFGAGVGLQRALEVVDERQQILARRRPRPPRPALALALDALAVVVELGRLAEQPIVVIVALPLELVRVGDRCAPVSTGSAVGCLVVVVHDAGGVRDEFRSSRRRPC